MGQEWRLPAGELALLGPRATSKRRAEFCAGRQAAHTALRRLLGRNCPDLLVLREQNGSPYVTEVTSGERLDVCLSITHASGRALAAAAKVRLGLDLVRVEPLGPAFAEEAFAPGELQAWCRSLGEGGDRAVATAFAAKEAALKWIGCGLRIPLHSLAVSPNDNGIIRSRFSASIQWESQRETCAGLCVRSRDWIWVALWTDPSLKS